MSSKHWNLRPSFGPVEFRTINDSSPISRLQFSMTSSTPLEELATAVKFWGLLRLLIYWHHTPDGRWCPAKCSIQGMSLARQPSTTKSWWPAATPHKELTVRLRSSVLRPTLGLPLNRMKDKRCAFAMATVKGLPNREDYLTHRRWLFDFHFHLYFYVHLLILNWIFLLTINISHLYLGFSVVTV